MQTLRQLPLKIFLLLFTVSVLSSCNKDEEFEFDLAFNNVAVTVGPLNAPPDKEVSYATTVFTNPVEAELNTYGASLQDVQSAKLKTLKLRIKTPAGRTLNDISFADAWLSASTIDPTKIAYKTDVPDTDLTEIEFESQFNDLTEFLYQDNFSLLVKAFHTAVIPDNTGVEIDFVITVKVKKSK